jgi:hypothetical protein
MATDYTMALEYQFLEIKFNIHRYVWVHIILEKRYTGGNQLH